MIELIYVAIVLFVVFLPTIAALKNGNRNWFYILIGNLALPLTGIGWLALLYLAIGRRR